MPRYFKKLLTYSIFITTLPIVIWGSLSYYQSYVAMVDSIVESNQQVLQQTQLRIEQLLKMIDHSAMQYISFPPFYTLFNTEYKLSHFSEINELIRGNKKLQMDRLGIADVITINKELDWMITIQGVTSYSAYEGERWYEKYKHLPESSAWVVDQTGIMLVKKLPVLTFSDQPTGLFLIKMNDHILTDMLMQENPLGSLFIFDERLQFIAGHREDIPFVQFLTSLIESHSTGKMDSVRSKWEEEELSVSFYQSSYNGWIYVSVLPLNEALRNTDSKRWLTLLIGLIILLFMVLIVLTGIRKIYYPIRKVYQSSLEKDSLNKENKSKDELLSIEQRIQTLSKAKSMLRSQIQQQQKYVHEFFMMRLLQEQVQPHEWEECKVRYKDHDAWRWVSVLALHVDKTGKQGFTDQDLKLLLYAINNIASEVIVDSDRLGTTVLDHTQISIVLGRHDDVEKFKQHCQRIAQLIQNSVFHYLNLEVSIGIGGAYRTIEDVHKSYSEALEALKYRIRLGSNVILHLEDIVVNKSGLSFYRKNLEEELVQAIRRLDDEVSRKKLIEYIENVFEHELEYNEYQLALVQLLTTLTKMIYGYGRSVADVFGHSDLLRDLFDLNSKEEIIEFFDQIIRQLISFFEEQHLSNTDNLTANMIEIIEQEFESDLTLEYCASKVNFHPSYVSRVFKKDTGISFSQYLADYRLKMAEKWLIETDMKISEIAERFKYNSPAAFIRYFKKRKGMTPGQFRNLYRKRKS